jgi:hypothetical protein
MRWVTPMVLVATASCAKTAQLHGRVVDCATSSPVDGADVQLTSKATGASWEAIQTTGDGQFAFDVQDPRGVGPLTLTAVKSGYRNGQKTFPTMPSGTEEVCIAPTLR